MNIIALVKAVLSCCLLLAVLAGCSPHAAAPISSRDGPPSNAIDYHIVSQGETLYAIAWRYELDYHALARANNIASPYTIFVGQKLTLDLSSAPVIKTASRQTPKYSSNKPSTAKTTAKKPVASAAKPKAAVPSKSVATTNQVSSKAKNLPSSWRWQWPATGRVQRHYDANKAFKGIYIYAGKGKPVKAAAPGVVVYAGSGLRGYGKLIILRHSSVYLSAYAQNRRILVKEGDVVSVGQAIAETGGDSDQPNRLYFEIRRDGKAIDPLRLLPKQ